MQRQVLLFFFFFLPLVGLHQVLGTHIRAGEITAERLSVNSFRFTLTVYGNSDSQVEFNFAIFDFGDGTRSDSIPYTSSTQLPNSTYKRVFETTHNYTGNGFFKVTFQEENRVAGIRNMASSDAVPLYLETMISISAQNVGNNPPYLTVPPIDRGNVGKLYTHNPGAIDPDGDSLSYKMVVPKSVNGTNAPGYFQPEASNSFSLDPVTGTLSWDTPIIAGLYNIAFIIEEWKKATNGYIRISYITRDMQIRIEDSPNNPPIVNVPPDTCIQANQAINGTITATDPDFNNITLTAFPDDHFTVSNPQGSPASGSFSWTPDCNDVQNQAHNFVFKAEDHHPINPYANHKSWRIKVIAPAPTGLTAAGSANSIVLNWDTYSCPNLFQMDIYRISCDSIEHSQTACQSGIQGFPGYARIGSVGPTVTTYSDNAVKQGLTYCYLLVAQFPTPGLGQSYASLQACASTSNTLPTISSVSVLSTDASAGSIEVRWADPVSLSGPFTYHIHRSDDNGISFTQIGSNVTSPYTDNNLNTASTSYQYKIELVGQGISAAVSSTFLLTDPSHQTVTLSWTETADWIIDSARVFRSINGAAFTELTLITPDDGSYIDTPLNNCDSVCYYIQRYHHYCLPQLSAPESQRSQIHCSIPRDNRPPEGPELTVTGCNGDLDIFENVLNWTDVSDPSCPNILYYDVYYSEYSGSSQRKLVRLPFNQLTYTDIDSQSLAGCYVVKAIAFDSTEGRSSNKVCVDNCVYYELPNLITPNQDAHNDLMNPFPVPRGVASVLLRVYNGWGQLVYEKTTGPQLNWPGSDSEGYPLLDGIYYFSAEVTYYHRLNPEDEKQLLKGWVQVLENHNTKSSE